jgi:glutathione S-transferase
MFTFKPKPLNNYFLDNYSLRIKGDENNNHSQFSKCPNGEDFKLYTMDLSYFSGKLEMYLRYKQITFQRIEPIAREFETILSANTRSEQLPQLYDCRENTDDNKRWLRDTSPMIKYLEQEYKNYPILPKCEVQRFFQFLFEDFADEYLWRHAMFMRWEPDFDRKVMGLRFFYEFAMNVQLRWKFIPGFLMPYLLGLRQWLFSSYGEDCTTDRKKDVVVNYYYKLLRILEKILQEQPYLFGNKPTLIDFAFSGPFFRHFFSDFTPRKIMQQKAPAVHEWVARLWNSKGSKFENIDDNFPTNGNLPANWNELIPLLEDYFRYMKLNLDAYTNKKKYFNFEDGEEVFKVPVVHYRAWSYIDVQNQYSICSPESKFTIRKILSSHNLLRYFIPLSEAEIEPECGTHPPFCVEPSYFDERLSHKWEFESIALSWIFSNKYTKVLVFGGFIAGGFYLFNNK